jgi:tetratricopeptide (TPR) repeat protein
MEFATESGSARALSFAHLAAALMASGTGDSARAVEEAQAARDATVDPFYKAIAEIFLPGYLFAVGNIEAAKAVVEPALKFNEEHGFIGGLLGQRMNQAVIMVAQGEPTKGLEQLQDVRQEVIERGAAGMELFTRQGEALIYSQIATGGASGSIGSTLGIMVRNPRFVLGKGRRASDTARELFNYLSQNLTSDQQSSRFGIEFEFAKLLIKRKEREEARKHLEKAIAFLQPIGDCVGMRDAKALLATLDAN